jgi:drug/metabolite transporter (DMT)-like permease
LAKMHVNKLPLFLMSALLHVVNLPLLFLIAPFTSHFWPAHLSLQSMSLLMVIGLSSAVFYVFWCIGCKRVSGATAGLFTAAMPLATLVIAWIFLREAISLLQFCGMLLVIVSIAFNAMAKSKKDKPVVDELQLV